MRALVLTKPTSPGAIGPLALRDDYPIPSPRPGESLVRVAIAGICGTDLEMIQGYMDFEGVPGHEFVGEVVSSGSAALVGQRVVGEINAACGVCEWCNSGMGRHCPHRTVLGILGRDGAFAEYLTLPDANLVPVNSRLPDQIAVFAEPLAAAFEIFEQTSIAPADRIAILGDGRLGAVTAMAMKSRGLNPVLGGHHQDKLRRLREIGIAAQEESGLQPGYDVVVDCTGAAGGLSRALALVRPRGKLILKTTVAGAAGINLAPIVIKEIVVIGSRCGRFAPALKALQDGVVDPGPLISAVFSLTDAAAAIARAAEPSIFKVLLQAS